ncbi:ATP-binding protein [Streptomyces sp. NPDC097617]|uniref:ATP-binding protein n=1 Tax=Streptomyces sp. NPDC097617 TaxID=3366091 RepID=UPI00381A878B
MTAAGTAFAQRFTATARGARLARQLALIELADWGIPLGSDASDTAGLVIAELASNAVRHGRVPGRDFELCMAMLDDVLRLEVTDARGERLPDIQSPEVRESGYGMRLIEALAADWGVTDRVVGKTVWVELAAERV